MMYRQIFAGPFYGLFAIHLDEYLGWEDQQEVVDKLDDFEREKGIQGSKKIIVFDGMGRIGKGEKSEEEIISLMEIIRSRGWFILLNCAGSYYPLHAKQANHVTAYIQSSNGRWLNFPANSIVWIYEGGDPVEPVVSPINANAPKSVYAKVEMDEPLELSLRLQYAWQFINPSKYRLDI